MAIRGSSKHRPGFHALVLSIGFIVGGALTKIARLFLPAGAAKEFLTAGVTPSLGPLKVDLVIITFSVGPVAMDVSLLSLFGVIVAYLIARSLF
ncbi:MAG TPA: DUF4321 domain-containing protein [Gemmatimonadaceae bacterium]|nr:DUF4321 domain-containing protein [Gemmatimonadaceae bacterium]